MSTESDKFDEYHAANPHVFQTFVWLADQWLKAGKGRLSMYMLRERARWEFIVTTEHDEFKISNNFTPYYARLIMYRHRRFQGMFVTKPAYWADEWIAALIAKEARDAGF